MWRDSFIIFGGAHEYFSCSDTFEFNTKTKKWRALNDYSPICFHSAVRYKDKMFVFGGVRFDALHFYSSNSVEEYDIVKNTWVRKQCTGKIPNSRQFHSACVYDQYMIIFGGVCDGYRMNDLHFLNLETFHWTSITTCGFVPLKINSHSAVVYADEMYVFGGFDGHQYYKQFCKFNFKNHRWTELPVIGLEKRCLHRVVVRDDCMILFGGTCGRDYYYNDFFIYRFERLSMKGLFKILKDDKFTDVIIY